MTKLLEMVSGAPVVNFAAGETIIREGSVLSDLFVLSSGEVQIRKQGSTICRINNPGSAFGEISALLGVKSTASVIAVKPCAVVVVKNALQFLSENHEATLEIARMLAHRVHSVTHKFMEELDDGDSVFWGAGRRG